MTFPRTLANSPIVAGVVLVGVPLLYSGGQEIFAVGSLFDDYYFLLRSESFGMGGSYNAAIKEYLYSVFIALARFTGLSLRNLEVLCYSMALLWLWDQTGKLAKSHLTAWITVIPLAVFTYQHWVFNRATYDALQLILTPLTIASSLHLYLKAGSAVALINAGCIAGLHTLNRPEGFLFVLPQLMSLALLRATAAPGSWGRQNWGRFLRQAAVVCLIPLAMQQGMSAINRIYFGFWAPTFIKSSAFQEALSTLMEIRPAGQNRYSPVPNSALERAYEVSPELRKAKSFFDQQINGQGWSSHAPLRYRDNDGSIPGGHFQWALVHASAHVAGASSSSMLEYLQAVATELRSALDSNKLEKRFVVSTAIGPEFSILDSHFWASARRLGAILLNLGEPTMPQLPEDRRLPKVESDFDRLALRRPGLLAPRAWHLEGWVANPLLGIPSTIELDQTAMAAGVKLVLLNRPDVAKLVLGLDSVQAPQPTLGFELSSQKIGAGRLTITHEDKTTSIALSELLASTAGTTFLQDGLNVHVEKKAMPSVMRELHFAAVDWVTTAAHYVMRSMLLALPVVLIFVATLRKSQPSHREERLSLVLVWLVSLSVVGPRWGLLSAIDSVMYPADEPRYLAAGAFVLWYLALFTVATVVRRAVLIASKNADEST